MGHGSFWRNFAMRAPRPALLRCHVGDDDHEINLVDTKQTFVQIAQTIDALNPDRVEAFDAEGTLLRAEKRRSTRNPVDVPSVLHEDPETARFIVMNDLLARAWQQSSEVAFNRMADFVQMLMDRDRSSERRIERLEQEKQSEQKQNLAAQLRAELAARGEGGEADGLLGEMLQAFMGGAGGARPQAPLDPDAEDEPEPPEDEPEPSSGGQRA